MSRCDWRRSALVGALLLLESSLVPRARAADDEHEQLAKRIVTTCADIQPGDVVVVSGGQHVVPLMEAISIEVQKAGGFVTMFLTSDRVRRSQWVDVPDKFLEQQPRFLGEWVKSIRVWIALPDLENPAAVLKDVPEVKIAAAAKASQFIVDIVQQSDVGFFVLTVPTAADAEENGLDLATYEQMQWAAMSADYAKISEQGQKLKQLLAQSRSVRITSPAGTDVTLSVGDRPIFVSDAVITPEESRSRQFMTRTASLPGGGVFFAPIEETVSGHVVVPKLRVFEKSFANIRCDFRNGTIADFQADEGRQYFDEIMAAHDGAKDIVSVVSIGLNPALHVIEEGRANYRPAEAAGMVWISTGANDLLGGRNVATGGFGFPITNATVTVDGKVVVKDGTLQP